MQISGMRRSMQILVEIAMGIVNGLMLLALYVADADCSLMGFDKPGIGVFAEIAFLIGIIAFALLIIVRRNIENILSRWILIVIVTFWNQTCLIVFLVSLIPFHSR
jgi:hypothetical protein